MIDVLIVDDDEAIAEFLEVILSENGYRVRTACTGVKALDILKENPPRVLLLDLMLPEMSSAELIKKVRRYSSTSIAVVVMSAHSDAEEAAKAMGALGCLRKPFDLDELLGCVASLVGANA